MVKPEYPASTIIISKATEPSLWVTPELSVTVARALQFYWEHRDHVVSMDLLHAYLWGEDNNGDKVGKTNKVLMSLQQELPEGERVTRVRYRGHRPIDILCHNDDGENKSILQLPELSPKIPKKIQRWLKDINTLRRTKNGDLKYPVSKLVVVASQLYASNYGKPVGNDELGASLEMHSLKYKGNAARERLRANLPKGFELYSLGYSEQYILASAKIKKLHYPDSLFPPEISARIKRILSRILELKRGGKFRLKTALTPQVHALLIYSASRLTEVISVENIPEAVMGINAISDGGKILKQHVMAVRGVLTGSPLALYSEWGSSGYRLCYRREVGKAVVTEESRNLVNKWPEKLRVLGRQVNELVVHENDFLIARFTPDHRKLLNFIGSAKNQTATYAELAVALGDDSGFKNLHERRTLKTEVNVINKLFERHEIPYRLKCIYKVGYLLVKLSEKSPPLDESLHADSEGF